MEIDMTYIAKDGRRFRDPLQCEDYEKSLGILPGSVGDLKRRLSLLPQDDYVWALVVVRDKANDRYAYYQAVTQCIDEQLEDYVNVESLSEEKRYKLYTVREFSMMLENQNQDAACQYMLFHSPQFQGTNVSACANHNPDVWSG